MCKRGAVFDVQTYTGTNVNTSRLHGLGKVPEMMWVKRRDSSNDWVVFNKDLHQYPQDYYLKINYASAVTNASQWWKPPTSTHWFTAIGGLNNINGATYIAMLFASVAGISKVGSYTGDGTASQTITTGFQPRFLIVKSTSASGWYVADTNRGWGAGNDQTVQLQESNAQAATALGAPTATGFTIEGGFNNNAEKWIYYAHA